MSKSFKTVLKSIGSAVFPGSKTLFDPKYYLNAYPDIAAAGVDPYQHFLKHGIRENRNPNLLFDVKYYLSQLDEFPADPTIHYVRQGATLGLNPHPQFNTRWYMENYRDVATSGMNPLLHYLRYGRLENRQTAPNYMKIFGHIMPHALGVKMPNDVGLVSFSAIRNQFLPKARYFRQIMVPFKMTNTERTSFLLAAKIASRKNFVQTEVVLRGGGENVSTNLCMVLYGCFISDELSSDIKVSFEEAHIFSIDNGNAAFMNGMAASRLSIAAELPRS